MIPNENLKKIYKLSLELQIEILEKGRITIGTCKEFRWKLSELNIEIDTYLSGLQDLGNDNIRTMDAENGFNGAIRERYS